MIRISEAGPRVTLCLQAFLRSIGHEVPEPTDELDLVRDLGLESDQGLDFALDLEDALECKLPEDFNPIVHVSGKRGMRLRELVRWIESYIESRGGAA